MRISSLALLPLVTAMWPNSWIVGVACGKAAQLYYPECSDYDYSCSCKNSQLLSTVERCVARNSAYNSTRMGEAWDRFTLMFCQINDVSVDEDIVSAAGNQTSVIIDQVYYEKAFRGQYNLLRQRDQSVLFGMGLCVYWLAICLFTTAARFLGKAAVSLIGPSLYTRMRPPFAYRWLQRNLFIPALYADKHMVKIRLWKFSFSIPSRLETVIAGLFTLLLVIFMLTPYTFMDQDPFYPSRWKEMMRYASDRSGILATMLMPLLLLFGMRNNILIWMTGWRFNTFNVYHRAVARAVYTLLIIHAVTKHIFAASYGGSLSKYYYPLMYFRYGASAMALFAIMVFVGHLRERYYELFLYSHIACAIGGLICSIYHLDHIGYRGPLHICFAIWAADIVIRGMRLVIFNVSLCFAPLPGSQSTTYATLSVYNEEVIQVYVDFPVRWKVFPGQYVYLHPSPWSYLSGHPFSVVGASPSGSGLELLVKCRNGMTKRFLNKLVRKGGGTNQITMKVQIEGPYGFSAPVHRYDEALFVAGGIGITGVLNYIEKFLSVPGRNVIKPAHLIWVVRRRKDFNVATKRLLILQDKGLSLHLYCRPEHRPLQHLSSHMNVEVAEKLSELDFSSASSISTSIETPEKIKTSWAEPKSTASDHERRIKLSGAGFVEFGDTSPISELTSSVDYVSVMRATERERPLPPLDDLISESRPDLAGMIRSFFSRSQGSVAVTSCGPAVMMDCVSAAVCKHLELVEYGRIDYFEEAFSW